MPRHPGPATGSKFVGIKMPAALNTKLEQIAAENYNSVSSRFASSWSWRFRKKSGAPIPRTARRRDGLAYAASGHRLPHQ